jgi:hypothetical protein
MQFTETKEQTKEDTFVVSAYWDKINWQWSTRRFKISNERITTVLPIFDRDTKYLKITSTFKESVQGHVKALPKDYNNQFVVTITNGNAKEVFEFGTSIADTKKQSPKISLTSAENVYAFYCFIGDAIAGSQTFEEFKSEFGYDDCCEAHKIWKACKESTMKAVRLGLGDLYEISNYLQETYPDVL